jgi:hypothetical protein
MSGVAKSWAGVEPSPQSTVAVANCCSVVPVLDDRWDDCGAVGGISHWQGKQKYSEKAYPSAALSTTNPTRPHDLARARTWAAAVGNRRYVRTAAHSAVPTATLGPSSCCNLLYICPFGSAHGYSGSILMLQSPVHLPIRQCPRLLWAHSSCCNLLYICPFGSAHGYSGPSWCCNLLYICSLP